MRKYIFLLLLISGFIANKGYSYSDFQNYGFYTGIKFGTTFLNFKEPHVKIKMNPGVSIDGFVGYRFDTEIRCEIEASYEYAKIHDVKADRRFFYSNNFIKGNYHSTRAMFNLLYDIALNYPVTPYFGAGAGYFYSQSHFRSEWEMPIVYFLESNYAKGGKKYEGFVWQAIAGLSYRICDGLESALEYRFVKETHIAKDNKVELLLRKFF